MAMWRTLHSSCPSESTEHPYLNVKINLPGLSDPVGVRARLGSWKLPRKTLWNRAFIHFEFLLCYNVVTVQTTLWYAENRKMIEGREAAWLSIIIQPSPSPVSQRLILTAKLLLLLLAGPCGLAAGWRGGLVDLQLVLRLQIREAGTLHGQMVEVPRTSSTVTASLLPGTWGGGRKDSGQHSQFSLEWAQHH